jgi:hypothetical protein
MNLRRWVMVIVLLPLVSCAATTPKCTLPRIPNDKAAHAIVFWPLDRGANFDFIKIAVDGCTVGELPKNDYLRIGVGAGIHRVQALGYGDGRGGDGEITTEFRASETLYLRYRKTPTLNVLGIISVTNRPTALKLMPALAKTDR